MVSGSEIRAHLAKFLASQIDLESFEDWFAKHTWNVHQSGSVAAENLTFAVEESLAEYSSSHISEHDLRAELSQILGSENKLVVFTEAPQSVFLLRTSAPLELRWVKA